MINRISQSQHLLERTRSLTARLLLLIVACIVALHGTPSTAANVAAQSPKRISVQQFVANTESYIGQTLNIEGRVLLSSEKLLRFRGCGISFRAADGSNPIPSKMVNADVIGQVQRDAGSIIVVVTSCRSAPSDLETFETRRQAIPREKSDSLFKLAAWARKRSEFYDDTELAAAAASAVNDGMLVLHAGIAGDDLPARKKLIEQAVSKQAGEGLRRGLLFELRFLEYQAMKRELALPASRETPLQPGAVSSDEIALRLENLATTLLADFPEIDKPGEVAAAGSPLPTSENLGAPKTEAEKTVAAKSVAAKNATEKATATKSASSSPETPQPGSSGHESETIADDVLPLPSPREFMAATPVDQQRLVRSLYTDVVIRATLASLAVDFRNGGELADRLQTRMPAAVMIADRLRQQSVAVRLKDVDKLPRREILSLVELLRKRGTPEKATEVLERHLSLRRERLASDDIDTTVALAADYRTLLQRPDLANLLLIETIGRYPDSVDLAEALQTAGFRKQGELWMPESQIRRATESFLDKALREGRVVEGMTQEQVKRSLGPPSSSSQILTAKGVTQIWQYPQADGSLLTVLSYRSRGSDQFLVAAVTQSVPVLE